MASSACDQKKAEIVRHAEMECSAEAKKAKAIYELKCLELKRSYDVRKNRACRDLEQQELEELGEIKRLYEAELEPIKAKHAEKLSAIREQYRIAAPEAGLPPSAISETPSSPTLVVVSQRLADQQQAEAGNKDTAASNKSIDDTQESGDETDTSIPAFTQEATSKPSKPAFASYLGNRKRRRRIFDSDDEESGFSQDENEDEQDSDSDFISGRSQKRVSRKALKASKEASAQRNEQNSVSSASPTKTKDRPRKDELAEILETRNEATPSSLQIDGQVEGGDEDEANYDGPASQAPRRNHVRPGRPKPGKYRMNAKAWPV